MGKASLIKLLDITLSNLSPEEKAKAYVERVNIIARGAYLEGNWDNPFAPKEAISFLDNFLLKACALQFEIILDNLKKEKVCPCCGQVTLGDLN